jgi:hypothetical protein
MRLKVKSIDFLIAHLPVLLVALMIVSHLSTAPARAGSITNTTFTYTNTWIHTNPGVPGTLYLASNGIANAVFGLPEPRLNLIFARSNIMVMQGGKLRVEFDGVVPATNYYRIIASNLAVFAGTFEFTVRNGFGPELGQTFEPILYSNRVGELTNVVTPALSNNLGWRISYGPNSAKLTVVEKDDPPDLKVVPVPGLNSFAFKLEGVLGETYAIESTTNGTGWLPILTNHPFTGFSELGLDEVETESTLYRAVRVIP